MDAKIAYSYLSEGDQIYLMMQNIVNTAGININFRTPYDNESGFFNFSLASANEVNLPTLEVLVGKDGYHPLVPQEAYYDFNYDHVLSSFPFSRDYYAEVNSKPINEQAPSIDYNIWLTQDNWNSILSMLFGISF